MGTIVDATVPTGQFALEDTFGAVADAEFEMVRVVAHAADRVLPFLWATSSEPDALEDALEADATTERVQHLAREDGRCLYRIEWQPRTRIVVNVLVQENGTLLGALGRDDEWEFRVLFPDHDSVSATYDFCKEYGIDLSVKRINGATELFNHGGVGLSKEQHEALMAAFEKDYYGVPRGMTLDGLAQELGVSHQALSERLRRSHRNLIANTLCGAPKPVARKP